MNESGNFKFQKQKNEVKTWRQCALVLFIFAEDLWKLMFVRFKLFVGTLDTLF